MTGSLIYNRLAVATWRRGCCEWHLKYIEQNCFSCFFSMQWTNRVQLTSYHNFIIVIPSHYSKQNPISWFHAEKIAEAVLLVVFRIAFQTSLLSRATSSFVCLNWDEFKSMYDSIDQLFLLKMYILSRGFHLAVMYRILAYLYQDWVGWGYYQRPYYKRHWLPHSALGMEQPW